MNEILKIVGSITLLFMMLLSMGMLSKKGIVSEGLSLFFFFMVFIIMTGWMLINLIDRIRNREIKDLPKTGLDYYLRKINEIIESRPSGEPLKWEGGKYVRYFVRIYHDINRQAHKYVAITAITEKSLKRVCVIYDTQENDIVEWLGDPSPDKISDPFFDFKPFGNRGGSAVFNPYDAYGRYPGGRGMPMININQGQGGVPDSTDDLGELDAIAKKK